MAGRRLSSSRPGTSKRNLVSLISSLKFKKKEKDSSVTFSVSGSGSPSIPRRRSLSLESKRRSSQTVASSNVSCGSAADDDSATDDVPPSSLTVVDDVMESTSTGAHTLAETVFEGRQSPLNPPSRSSASKEIEPGAANADVSSKGKVLPAFDIDEAPFPGNELTAATVHMRQARRFSDISCSIQAPMQSLDPSPAEDDESNERRSPRKQFALSRRWSTPQLRPDDLVVPIVINPDTRSEWEVSGSFHTRKILALRNDSKMVDRELIKRLETNAPSTSAGDGNRDGDQQQQDEGGMTSSSGGKAMPAERPEAVSSSDGMTKQTSNDGTNDSRVDDPERTFSKDTGEITTIRFNKNDRTNTASIPAERPQLKPHRRPSLRQVAGGIKSWRTMLSEQIGDAIVDTDAWEDRDIEQMEKTQAGRSSYLCKHNSALSSRDSTAMDAIGESPAPDAGSRAKGMSHSEKQPESNTKQNASEDTYTLKKREKMARRLSWRTAIVERIRDRDAKQALLDEEEASDEEQHVNSKIVSEESAKVAHLPSERADTFNEAKTGRREDDSLTTVESMSDSTSNLLEASVKSFDSVAKEHRRRKWLESLKQSDPRWQILKAFDDISEEGADDTPLQPEMINPKASVFTVWRPTSTDAIKKMMTKEGCGKGLGIKGKSAKTGELSGFVPFLQIHEEEHKNKIRTLPKSSRVRIFYKTREARDIVGHKLGDISKFMSLEVARAKIVLCNPESDDESISIAARSLMWNVSDPKIHSIDYYAPNCFGLDVACRLFWEFVHRLDITREPGSKFDTGRTSQPAFQDMNFASFRRQTKHEPRTVLWQCSDDPIEARSLVLAYEDNGHVLPVVSDFDCFLVGTRGVKYESHLPPDQVDALKWCVSQVGSILDSPTSYVVWTSRWLDVLKRSAVAGTSPAVPKYGFGDSKSTAMMEHAIKRLQKSSGAVRHGAECFNYCFPQELDDHFFVISDSLPNNRPWMYVNEQELQELLAQKIDEGYTFPLNPKWVLCDSGWKRLYDALLASADPIVRDSIDVWYPRESGVREQIDAIHKRHPDGFELHAEVIDGTEAMDLAQLDLKNFVVWQRAKRKMRGSLFWLQMLRDIRAKNDCTLREALMSSLRDFQFLGDVKLGEMNQTIEDGNDDGFERDLMASIQDFKFFG